MAGQVVYICTHMNMYRKAIILQKSNATFDWVTVRSADICFSLYQLLVRLNCSIVLYNYAQHKVIMHLLNPWQGILLGALQTLWLYGLVMHLCIKSGLCTSDTCSCHPTKITKVALQIASHLFGQNFGHHLYYMHNCLCTCYESSSLPKHVMRWDMRTI